MKPKTLGILAALVLVLGAFIWLVERDLPGTEERAEQAKKVLGGVERTDIEALTLSIDDRQVRLERVDEASGEGADEGEDEDATDASWRLTAPLEARADDAAVDRLLLTLGRLEKQTTVEDPDRVDLGLEPPEATVTVTASGREQTLQVGVEIPVAGGRVVSLEGQDEVWVTEGELWDEITQDPDAWRSKEAVPWSASEIVRLRLSGEGREAPVEIVREEVEGGSGARFRLVSPVSDVADRQTVQDLTSRLATLRAEEFLDDAGEAPEDVDPASPRFVAELFDDRGEGTEPYRLEMIAPLEPSGSRWLVRAEGQLMETEAPELVELSGRPPRAWRSHLATDLQIFEVDRVKIEQEGRDEMVLARVEGDWVRDGEALAYGPVRELLVRLTSARAVEVEPTAEASVGEPRLVFHVEPNVEGLPTEALSVYDDEAAGVPVHVVPRGVVLRFESGVIEEIEKALQAIRDAEPLADESAEDRAR